MLVAIWICPAGDSWPADEPLAAFDGAHTTGAQMLGALVEQHRMDPLDPGGVFLPQVVIELQQRPILQHLHRRDQVSVPHELEVVAPEPASASLLDKRRPATSTPQVHCYGADTEQFCGLRAGQPVLLGIRRLKPAFAPPRRSPRSGPLLGLGQYLQHLIVVQRRSPHATAGGEFASRDQLPDQRHMATKDLGRLSLGDPHAQQSRTRKTASSVAFGRS